MGRHVILLLTAFVFILAFTGTVAAEDSQGGVETTIMQGYDANGSVSPVDPRIYGVIKENGSPAAGANITVRDPSTGELLASAITNSTGAYDISFISNLTEFRVEIKYADYPVIMKTVKPGGTPVPTAELNHTFVPSRMLKPVKVVILATRLQAIGPITKAYYDLLNEGYYFELKVFSSDDVGASEAIRKKFGEEILDADILYMFHVNNPLTAQISPLLQKMKNGSYIFQTSCSGVFEGVNVTNFGYSSVFSSDLSKENLKRVILELLRRTGSINISANDTAIIPMPKDFIYHPDTDSIFNSRSSYIEWYTTSGHYKPGSPWIGIVFHSWLLQGNDLAVYNKLIKELESRGANVIALASDGSGSRRNATLAFFTENGTVKVDCIIAHLHASYAGNLNSTLDLFDSLNVPVINPVHTSMLLNDYLEKSQGLISELSAWVITPETEGRIEPILIGGSSIDFTDPITGAVVKTFAPYEPGVRQLVERAIAWANLKRKQNDEKRIALVYIDNTHDETMPTAAGLNLPSSIANILNMLLVEGYSLNNTAYTNESVLALINSHGRNLVNYTQNDLKNLIEKGAITVSASEYMNWYMELPENLRKQVEAIWGPAPGNMMVYNGQIVIPGIILGNIFLGPQPIWKWNGTLTSILNNETLPPTHQYIAFYMWLQKKFMADAYVQIGTHGTLELLPGHSAGMTADDWPNTLIGYMPHIYIRNMAGEDATAAKRRAYAVIITHLTPPITETGLYGEYATLKDIITSYESALNTNDTQRMDILKSEIMEAVYKTGLDRRLGINNSTDFNIIMQKLDEYLSGLEKTLTSSGLHTFGVSPTGDVLEKFLDAIISFDPGNRTELRNTLRSLILESGPSEMNSLVKALNGGYIKPVSSGDPIRSPFETLPSGRNIYLFDPRRVPDSAAMKIGSNATEEMLRRYKDSNNGKYPETVGIDIRGGEVIQTNGQSIASVFYLLGVKPVYNQGILVGTEVIPLSELGRPRIDVLIQASVTFRDMCQYTISIIDDAIRKVAMLDEPVEMNYVRKHYLTVLTELVPELKNQGLNATEAVKQAELLAGSRIFGLPPGADPHGVGVGRLLRSSTSWTDKDLTETYLAYNSYIYGNGLEGISGRIIFEKLIKTVDTTMSITPRVTAGLPTPLYTGSGVMNFVVKYLTGKSITSYIIKTGDGKPRVMTIQEAVYDDLAATLLNPEWKNALLKEGYSGRTAIALRIRGLFSTDALVDVVDSATWQKIANTYIFDKDMFSQFDRDQQNMIAGVIYQAYKRGLMQLSSEQASQLARILGLPVGTQDTPNTNPSNPPASHDTSSAGQSPGRQGTEGRATAGEGQQSEAGLSHAGSAAESGEQAPGDAKKAYEISEADTQKNQSSQLSYYAVAGIIAILSLAGIGFFFKGGPLSK
ncbi:cobaltochelatase subunit CobN [Methanothermobacter wolfeii]|uniref:cobaltochelatase subunit CobN n=1 Tax=Methanothermobacter wolfeii TaxID=145261 RepID=UPI0024B364A2|nr:cobaltochelatase subunit CobN [Methanothermobacter wolfeii]MDI6701479.1 cobaltochelatase subunit CobN [Methanothermobacter wolfeii]MDI6842718.1 cobaltochelatase subunit CobN [Methanothermobacter wolfeii]